ncbi:putative basic proline-rich protein-like [Iris pallida]|uniref:Basic proline-rich protein-like n=1 Tax=Iris pallida TaxID=29817 RepID=A0AAX6HYE5_IRIPA|nr:putative basic proline-rich protein-like [Iris pallida]
MEGEREGWGKLKGGFTWADGAGGRRALDGGSAHGKEVLEEGERGGDGWSERRRIHGRRGRRTPVEAVARPTELGLPEEGGGGTGCGARRSWMLHRGWSPIGEVGEVGGARWLLRRGRHGGSQPSSAAGSWVAHAGAIARLLAGGHVVGGRRGGEFQICADTTETCPSSAVGNPAVDADHGVEALEAGHG